MTLSLYVPLIIFGVIHITVAKQSPEYPPLAKQIEANSTPESTEASATPESTEASATPESNLESKLESIKANATPEFQARFDQTKHAGEHIQVQA